MPSNFDLNKYAEELERAVSEGKISPEEAEKLFLEARAKMSEVDGRHLDEELKETYARLKEHGKKAGVIVKDLSKKIYENHVKGFNGFYFSFFLFLFFLIWIFEYLNGGLSVSFSLVRLTYILLFVLFVNFFSNSSSEDKKFAFSFSLFNLLLPVFFQYIYIMSKKLNFILLDDIVYVFYGILTPAVLWWFFLYKREETFPPFLYKVLNYAVPIVMILLVFSGLNPVIGSLNNIQSRDTGFDSGKFTKSFSESLAKGVRNILFLNSDKECSGFSCVSDWFNKNFVEPFQYKPTKVDDITNLDLGIYIRDLNIPSEINVDPFFPGEFVVPPVRFYLESPIDSKVWSSICNNDDVIGNICDEKVFFYCNVESSDTKVEPSYDSFYNVVASKKKLVVCNIYRPLNVGSKKVNVSVVYPFVTNTFKILRLVNVDYLRSNPDDDVLNILDSDNAKLIVSNGGPVIVSSSEDKYILVSDNTKIPILFSFKPVQDFKLKSIDNVFLTLPKGIVFSSTDNNKLCDFVVKNNDNNENNNENGNVNGDSRVTYVMSSSALKKLNDAVKSNNDYVGFSCVFEVNKQDLDFEGYSFVEKSLNLVTKYRVVEEKEGSIFFSGTSISDFNPKSSFNVDSYNNLRGCVPYTFLGFPFSNVTLSDPLNGKGYFTSCYEYRKDVSPHNHLALDIGTGQLSDPYIDVFSSTSGEVIYAGWDNTGYGNLVSVKSKVGENDNKKFYVITLYGHLKKITDDIKIGKKVSVGDKLGLVGSTGNSNGPHLHFEVRLLVRDKDSGKEFSSTINPLYFNTAISEVRNSKINSYANAKQCFANFNYVIGEKDFVCKEDAYPLLAEKFPSDSTVKEMVYEEFKYRNANLNDAEIFYNTIISDSNCRMLRPSFILGVAVAETSLRSFSCDNNYFNIKYNSQRVNQDGSCDNSFAKYSSVERSVKDFCSLIVNNYIPRGQNTVDKLVVGDYLYNADKNHNPWLNNIKSVMDKYAVYGV